MFTGRHRLMIRLAPICVLLPLAVSAQERSIPRSAVPDVVIRALQANLAGAQIKNYVTDHEAGKTVCEIETLLNGHTRDLQFSADGTLNEIEEEVALASLPISVQKGLQSRAGTAKIVKVESLTQKGVLVAYEASTRRGPIHGEVQVGPDGETLRHPQ